MTLRLATDDIEEVRRALFSAYREVLLKLAQCHGPSASPAGIQLCRRKSRLEAMLRLIEGPEEPPPVLAMVPRQHQAALERVAA